MSRRAFLKTSAAVGVGALAAACQAPSPAAPTAAPTEALETELNVLNWGSYIDFAIEPFQQKYGVKVNVEYYASEDEAINKVKASPGQYDTFNVGVGFLEPAVKQGLVQPLDISRIASYPEMYPEFQPGPFGVDGQIYGVCYAFGTNALMYNSELVPEGVDSWLAFVDPKFKGKTALVDKPKDQFLPAMLSLGLDFTVAPSDADFERVKQHMKDRVANMRTLWSSGDDVTRFMINEEVVLADAYDGLAGQIRQQYPAIVYRVPKEGTYGWFDGPEMLTGAPHPNLTYKWIEFITSAEMAQQVAEQVNYSPGNAKVPEMISADLRTQLSLDNPGETLKGLKFWVNLGPDMDRKIADAWTEAKAGA
jgi:spermidine/putrescine transport system substrate-binding protein